MIFLRLALLVIIGLLSASPAMAEKNPPPAELSPLREFVLGATRDDIRKYETATFYKTEGDSDFYVDTQKDFYRTIRYDFKDGKLWRGQYSYDQFRYADPMKVFTQAANMQIALEKIYGKPAEELMVWTNDRYRYNPKRLGSALRRGDVKIRTIWTFPQTEIVMETYNDGTVYQLMYTAAQAAAKAEEKDDDRNILNLPIGEENQP